MDNDTFRRLGHEIVDWIADYRRDIREHPVLSTQSPGALRDALPAQAPEQPEDPDKILREFQEIILPGITHWSHPRFFAYFPANNSEPSILAEMLTAALGVQGMSWQTSPAATELEQVTTAWLARMLDLPGDFVGCIHDTASVATLVALLMARERATGGTFREAGAAAKGAALLRVYASEESHSSVEKATFLSGIGRQNLVQVPTDDSLAMDPIALENAIREDRSQGLIPCAVVATIGSTSTTAVDPLAAISRICRTEDIFLHVDAAFAGSLAILPEHRPMLDGVEDADSFVFNPHKWLFTNFDCSVHFVRDPDLLQQTCAINPEYLKTAQDAEVVNFRDWGIPLGRRFRALKLWWVLRTYGVQGLQERLRGALRLCEHLRDRLAQDNAFELLPGGERGLLCFRVVREGLDAEGEDSLTQRVLEAVNESGEAYLTHTRVRGRYVIRAHTAQALTGKDDVDVLFETLHAASRQ